MKKIFVTRTIPDQGLKILKEKGFEIKVRSENKAISKKELISELKKGYDALLCLLTDKIDGEIMDAGLPQLKIIANYAVGFDNINIEEGKKRNLMMTNTPGPEITESVAEHTFALMIALARRIAEADRFARAGKYKGWDPMLLLGTGLHDKTLGIIGLGRIGFAVAQRAVKGFKMKVLYHDVKPNPDFEKEFGAQFVDLETLLKESDFISIHVPLLTETRHLIGENQLRMMRKNAYLINTSRGPIIDEKALVQALKENWIRGAALDVYENEPVLAPGLAELDNAILTSHIASATEETRAKMSELAARNIIAALEGKEPQNLLK